MSGLRFLSFTERGKALAESLCAALGGTALCTRDRGEFSLRDWTEEAFRAGDDLVFVGAAGIAVRAVAPFLKSKASDPAVVAVDEGGSFVIPLVSGHLGGANALARRVAGLCGGTPVITTATDVNGRFAVDLWAGKQGLILLEPERIRKVSSGLLAGETVLFHSLWPIGGTIPEGVAAGEACDFAVDFHRSPEGALHLTPRTAVLGVGCRKGTPRERLEAVFGDFCRENDLLAECICAAATIDLKAEEPGLLEFCEAHGWPLTVYGAEKLAAAAGEFTASEFVKKTTGVDNVCERSCALAAGETPAVRKYARDGVTLALAVKPPVLDWSWKDE